MPKSAFSKNVCLRNAEVILATSRTNRFSFLGGDHAPPPPKKNRKLVFLVGTLQL